MIPKFVRSLIRDKIKQQENEIIFIVEDCKKFYASMADLHPFTQLAIEIRLLKIAILEAILGEGK